MKAVQPLLAFVGVFSICSITSVIQGESGAAIGFMVGNLVAIGIFLYAHRAEL